ncbi:dipeptidase [Phycicoccus sp. BSK3Z-2]|uniref:Dipeptidase n=1 Tax=Phycicoccus avicenniae TaxID=2828860 RepID=A0A941DA00_9MICO|nr:dipeptidase [Phycicoccus avicenniae]MBR7744475.1 dipeptidase [Phycicoccus avicenniae]
MSGTTGARVRALLERHPVLDGHNDLPWAARELVRYDWDRLDVGLAGRPTHTDLPRLRAGGVGGQFWSVYVPSTLQGDQAVTATLEQVDAVHTMVRRYAGDLALATTRAQVEDAMARGRIASLIGAEGGHSIDSSLGALRMLFALGVRYLTLTHNDNTPWADSATDEPVLGGLSPFGREVVREMNRLGMVVDLSHVSADTMRAALDVTEAPVLFSHSSARAVCDHPRNVPDDVLARVAGNRGVCMVTFVPKFVSPAVREWDLEATDAAAAEGVSSADHLAYSAFTTRWREEHPMPEATVEDVVRHCEHVREVAGVEHMGLGGDYDGCDVLPVGLEDVSGYPRLLAALADRGWSDAELGMLTSGNVLRLLGDVEERAADVAATRGPSLATIEDLDGAAG